MDPVLILVSQRYNYREFWPTLKVLRAAGIPVQVYSTGKVICPEKEPTRMNIVDLIPEVDDGRSWSGMMVISGFPGDTEKYYKHPFAQGVCKRLSALGVPIAAICAAVPSIAPAVQGRKVSWFPLIKSREILLAAGAILMEVGLTVDGNIVTAENEWATEPWAELFRDMVLGKEVVPPLLVPSGHGPKKIPRRYNPITGEDTLLCSKGTSK